MAITSAPKIVKWPFFAADIVLIGVGGWLLLSLKWPPSPWLVLSIVTNFSVGAIIAILPFIKEHAAAVKLWEQVNLAEAAQQLDQLVTAANRVAATTREWENVQASAQKTQKAAAELAEQITAESKAFAEFLQRSELQEKQSLRFELEKARRHDAEMLQVMVHLLDHTYALRLAGARSGQPQLAQQLSQFRAACLDTARRVGLVAYEAEPGTPYDPQSHQTVDNTEPPTGSVVAETVASGYTFQGQPIRRILVAVHPSSGLETSNVSTDSDQDGLA